jgi:hypothetical protein
MKMNSQAQLSNKEKKDRVVSFRLAEADVKVLEAHLAANACRGIRSDNQLARKIVLDFLKGELGCGQQLGLMVRTPFPTVAQVAAAIAK